MSLVGLLFLILYIPQSELNNKIPRKFYDSGTNGEDIEKKKTFFAARPVQVTRGVEFVIRERKEVRWPSGYTVNSLVWFKLEGFLELFPFVCFAALSSY